MADIRRFESEFLDYVGRDHKQIFDTIVSTGSLGKDVVTELKAAIDSFKEQFVASDGTPVVDVQKDKPSEGFTEGHETVTAYTHREPDPGSDPASLSASKPQRNATTAATTDNETGAEAVRHNDTDETS